jgi:hypothetical protein
MMVSRLMLRFYFLPQRWQPVRLGAATWLRTAESRQCHEDTARRVSVLECAGPPALSDVSQPAKSSRGLEHSRTASVLECHGAIGARQNVSTRFAKKQSAGLSDRALMWMGWKRRISRGRL